MNASRRKFVRTSIVGSMIGLTGCLGYELIETDRRESLETELNETKTELNRSQATISQLESEINSIESQLESRQNDIEELEGEVAAERETRQELETEVETLETERAMVPYEYGYALAIQGLDMYGTAVSNWNDGNYLEASQVFERGYSLYSAAVEAFNKASQAPVAQSQSRFQGIVDDADTYTNSMAGVCNSMANSAREVTSGNIDTAEQHFDDATPLLNEARESDLATPDDARAAL